MRRSVALVILTVVAFVIGAGYAEAQPKPTSSTSAAQTQKDRDGQHDFDFHIGTWKTHLKRLMRPLTGSTTWVEYEGTTVVRKVWDGRANLVELVAEGPAGKFEGLSLRLYNPQTRQWSLNFSGINSGAMSPATIGGFKNGRGEFYNQETLNGRPIFVRFVISDISTNSCRFEQAFSEWRQDMGSKLDRHRHPRERMNFEFQAVPVSAGSDARRHDCDRLFARNAPDRCSKEPDARLRT